MSKIGGGFLFSFFFFVVFVLAVFLSFKSMGGFLRALPSTAINFSCSVTHVTLLYSLFCNVVMENQKMK